MNVTSNDVVANEPSAFVALITTVYGVSSSPVPLQLHVPLVLTLSCVTEPPPDNTLIVTASSTSENVPVFPTAVNSGAVTEAASAATAGATSVALTVKEVIEDEPLVRETVRELRGHR